jgi:hypothetical protein
MRDIFLSYRRGDASGHVGRLQDRLVKDFPRNKVFMDVNAVSPGRDFPEVIRDSISTAGIVVVVIGERWLGATDQSGRRRLDNPDDYVRVEIMTALRSQVPLVPVLVGGPRCRRPKNSLVKYRSYPVSRRLRYATLATILITRNCASL